MKLVVSMVSTLLILFLIAGCSKNESEKSGLSIRIGDENLSYKVIDDILGDSDSLFSFAFDINSTYVIEEVEIGDKIYLDFGDNPPDEFYIRDYLLSPEGDQQYDEKLILDVPVQGDNDKYYFVVDIHMASYLSSFYVENKKDNRGFMIITNTNGYKKTYQFVIRTKAA